MIVLETIACSGGSMLGVAMLVGLVFKRREKAGDHPQEWLFSALSCARRDVLVKGDPDINWNDTHPRHGTPLHAIGTKGIEMEADGWPSYDWTPESKASIKDILALFEFALQRGADPTAICPRRCSSSVRFRVRVGRSVLFDLKEEVGGKSVISLWLALSEQAKVLEKRNPEQLPLTSSFCDGILSLLLHVVPKHQGFVDRQCRISEPPMAEVPEATARMWQRVMDSESGDVIFACVDGDVVMHSAVMSSTSKVLAAMLCWPRDDPQWPWRVELQDTCVAVKTWRALVYTGLPPVGVELTTALLLEVLDISHRWQDHLLECGILVAALTKRVSDSDSCSLVLQAAIAKDLTELRNECLAFARRSKEVQRDWEKGLFPEDVGKHFGAMFAVTRRGAGKTDIKGSGRWDW